jgi:hypothetical protein
MIATVPIAATLLALALRDEREAGPVELPRLLIAEGQDAIARQLRWALSDEHEASVASTGQGGARPAEDRDKRAEA